MKNPYETLGVARDADQAAIRKAFKALARKYHPDVNKDPAAEPRFKEISAAYDVLGDEQKRAQFDEFGEASLGSGFDADKARAWRNMGGDFGGGGRSNGSARRGGVSFEDFFGGSGFGAFGGFGGGGPAGRGGAVARGRGADIEGRVRVSFLDAVRGGQVGITIRRPAACATCKGEGGTGRTACKACAGSGRRNLRQMGMTALVMCDECGGEGATYAEECATCGGTGRIQDARNLSVTVPAGVESGQVIRLRGQGGEGRQGGPAGDLLLSITVDEHPLLRREGRDLEMDLPVRLAEAVGGATVEVPTPTGRLRVKVPPGSANGQRLRLTGRGVQQPGSPGDLYLVLRPVMPPSTDADAVELARRLDALTEADPRAGLVI